MPAIFGADCTRLTKRVVLLTGGNHRVRIRHRFGNRRAVRRGRAHRRVLILRNRHLSNGNRTLSNGKFRSGKRGCERNGGRCQNVLGNHATRQGRARRDERPRWVLTGLRRASYSSLIYYFQA